MTERRRRARRLAAACGAALWLAAACSGDDDGQAGSPRSETTTATDGGAPPTETGASGGTGQQPGDTTVTVAPGVTSPEPTVPGPPSMAPPGLDADVPVGRFAPAYLRDDLSSSLVVEVAAQDGADPSAAALQHLVTVLGDVSGKPVAVEPLRLGDGPSSWSDDDVRGAADAAAVTPQGDGTAVVRLLFVHGRYGDGGVLGVAVRGDVAAVFVDEVASTASLLVSAAAIERAVTLHEVGHLLGLVDLHLGTSRGDPDHPGHSRNRGSVMYWAVESTLVGQVLGGPPPDAFDADDRADLAAIAAGG
jgi:hypothetical protein